MASTLDPVPVAVRNDQEGDTIKPRIAVGLDSNQKRLLKRDASLWQAFRGFIWDADHHLKSAEEKRLLRKLDWAILPALCLGYFCKYLDQNNLTSAYVSGMKEDLAWYGNEYTYAVSLYTAAYAIMQIPSTIIVQYVKPSLWLGLCEVGWGIITVAQSAATNTATIYGLRFTIGFLESAFFPVGLFLLGSWYTPSELAKRTAIFHWTAAAGTAFGGHLPAIYRTMNGHAGWEGWRWLYVFCGIITIPCGLLVFFVLPNYPTEKSGKPWFLTQAEFEMAQERMRRVGREQSGASFSVAAVKKIFSGWHVYVLPITYICYGLGCQASAYFAIFLKSTGEFSIVEVNILPTYLSIIQIVTVTLWGFLSDYFENRYVWSAIPTLFSILSSAILTAWPKSTGFIMAAFYLGGPMYVTAIIYSWWSEICHEDPLERALVIGMSNGLSYAFLTWVPLVIYPQIEAPQFKKGYPTTMAFAIITVGLLTFINFHTKREKRRYAAIQADSLELAYHEHTLERTGKVGEEGDGKVRGDDKSVEGPAPAQLR